MSQQQEQQQNRRFGFFLVPDPPHWDLIKNRFSFVAWPHHSKGGSLIGFGFCDDFREVENNADTHCYEWEFRGGQPTAKHIAPTALFE